MGTWRAEIRVEYSCGTRSVFIRTPFTDQSNFCSVISVSQCAEKNYGEIF